MAQVRVQSDSDPSTTYLVDPETGICTCPSSVRLQAEGKGRVCKHVQRVRETGVAPASEEGPAPPSELSLVLAHPDPDPEALPDTIPADLIATMEIASRILRAAKRAEGNIEILERRRNTDLRAWDDVIVKEQARVDGWKAGILHWMQKHGIEQIKTPWLTAYIRKGGSKIVLDNEEQAKATIKTLNYPAALESVERIVWEEFKVLFDSAPDKFAAVLAEDKSVLRPAIAHRETGDPSLVIRKGKAKE